jgi:hypothetical protein
MFRRWSLSFLCQSRYRAKQSRQWMRPRLKVHISMTYDCWYRSTHWLTPCKLYLSQKQNNTKKHSTSHRSTRLLTTISSIRAMFHQLDIMPNAVVMPHSFKLIVWVSLHPFDGAGTVTTTHQRRRTTFVLICCKWTNLAASITTMNDSPEHRRLPTSCKPKFLLIAPLRCVSYLL